MEKQILTPGEAVDYIMQHYPHTYGDPVMWRKHSRDAWKPAFFSKVKILVENKSMFLQQIVRYGGETVQAGQVTSYDLHYAGECAEIFGTMDEYWLMEQFNIDWELFE
jgi:hypothetical protein